MSLILKMLTMNLLFSNGRIKENVFFRSHELSSFFFSSNGVLYCLLSFVNGKFRQCV